MKKTLLLSFVLAMLVQATSAQNILIKDYSGNDVTNSTYVHVPVGKGVQEASLKVEMRPGVIIDTYLALKRYEKKSCALTENFFCWTLCYGAVAAGALPLWEDGAVLVEVDSIFDDFHAYYDPKDEGTDGEFLYVIYDTSNVMDSSWVLIRFDYGVPTCDADDISQKEKVDVTLFPNPANDFFVVSNTESNDKVEVLDILGQSVYYNSKASAIHQLKGIKQGLYLVRITRDNEIIYTERLIVN